MKIKKNSTDIMYSSNGDFFLSDKTGDLARANTHDHKITKQIVIKRLESSHADWKHLRTYGANLTSFIGKRNTMATGEMIKATIVRCLTYDGLINPSKIQVELLPTGARSVLIVLQINAPSTVAKTPMVITFTYDLRNNKLVLRRN